MSKNIEERCRKILGSANLKLTKQRQAVLSVLLDANAPISQHDIADSLGENAPDKVTIYRVLQTFVDADIVHKAFLNNRTWHFELAHNCTEHQCHPHFTCTSCGNTHCMPGLKIPMAKSSNGFTVNHQQIQLQGICPQCNK